MKLPRKRATHDTVTPVNTRECFPGVPAMATQRRNATMTTRRILATVALGLFLGFPGLAKAQFNFTTYDVPGSTRTAVNESSPHAIAGEFDDASGNTHGFVLSSGVFTQIDVPGASFTSVRKGAPPRRLFWQFAAEPQVPSCVVINIFPSSPFSNEVLPCD